MEILFLVLKAILFTSSTFFVVKFVGDIAKNYFYMEMFKLMPEEVEDFEASISYLPTVISISMFYIVCLLEKFFV